MGRVTPDADERTVDRNGLDVMDPAQCRARLAAGTIGRLGLSVRALPVILPVNYLLIDEGVLVRAAAGAQLDTACDQTVVAFEVDGFDASSHTGWSVLVQGTARLVDEASLGWGADPPAPGAGPQADRGVVVSLDVVTGHRLGGWYRGSDGVAPSPGAPPSLAPR